MLGDVNLHVGGAEATEHVGQFGAGEGGGVAFVAEMGAVNVTQAGMDNLTGKVCGSLIGKVAVTAGDALFEGRGATGAVA